MGPRRLRLIPDMCRRSLPADFGSLDRGMAAGPGFVQALEGEQAFGEALFEDWEGFGGGGYRGG